MSEAHHYPPLRLGLLQGLVQLKERVTADPAFLKGKDCPYDPETIGILEGLFVERVVEKIVMRGADPANAEKRGRGRPTKDQQLTGDDAEELEQTTKELLSQLKQLGDGAKTLETGEKIQIIKAKSALVEQLLKMRERMMNVKRMANFQAVVISVLDDLVEEDGRAEFLKRIEPYRD
jgi:hypothetical protein